MTAATMIQEAIQDSINQPEAPKANRPATVVVTFHQPGLIPLFVEEFNKAGITLTRHKDYLYLICDSLNQAQHTRKIIDRALKHFDDRFLTQPYHPEWLSAYLDRKRIGVDVVMVMEQISSVPALTSYLDEQSERDADFDQYLNEREALKQSLSEYSISQFQNDLTTFLVANFAHNNIRAEQITEAVDSVIQTLLAEARGQFFLEDHCCQKLIYAIEHKEQAMSKDSIRLSCEQLRALTRFRKLSTGPKRQVMFKTMKSKAWEILVDQALYLTENEWTRFQGPLIETGDVDSINYQLHPSRLKSSDGKKINKHEKIAEAIVVYFIRMMMMQHEAALENELVSLSKNLDSVSFSENLFSITCEARPVQ